MGREVKKGKRYKRRVNGGTGGEVQQSTVIQI